MPSEDLSDVEKIRYNIIIRACRAPLTFPFSQLLTLRPPISQGKSFFYFGGFGVSGMARAIQYFAQPATCAGRLKIWDCVVLGLRNFLGLDSWKFSPGRGDTCPAGGVSHRPRESEIGKPR